MLFAELKNIDDATVGGFEIGVVRTSGHSPVDYGCFCDEHIRRFNQKMGTNYPRSEIAARLLAHGTPDPIREQWLDFVGEVTGSTI